MDWNINFILHQNSSLVWTCPLYAMIEFYSVQCRAGCVVSGTNKSSLVIHLLAGINDVVSELLLLNVDCLQILG